MTQSPSNTDKSETHHEGNHHLDTRHHRSPFSKSWATPGFLTGFFGALAFLLIGMNTMLAEGATVAGAAIIPALVALMFVVTGIIATAMRFKELGLEKNMKYTIERDEFKSMTAFGMVLFVVVAVVAIIAGNIMMQMGYAAGFNSGLDLGANALPVIVGLIAFVACLTIMYARPWKSSVFVVLAIVVLILAIMTGLFSYAIGAHIGWLDAGHSNNA